MRRHLKLATCALLLGSISLCWADRSLLKLAAFPSVSVADGKSTVTISAEVRDSGGHLVPNGTQVMFTTTLGGFRDSVVSTINGVATAVLVAGGIPGSAQISASPLGMDGSPTILSYEFVGSRSELSTAREYVEIVAPGYMQFANDSRIIGAAAPNKGVSLRYRDVEIQADDLQLDISACIVRARKARVHIGRTITDFDEINLSLRDRHGYGTTTLMDRHPDTMAIIGQGLVFLRQKAGGGYEIAPLEARMGVAEINREKVVPATTPIAPSLFEFIDLSNSPSTVSAKKAVVFPQKKIQFQSAEIFVAGAKIVRLPLFVVNLQTANGPLVTDDILSVNDNQLALNYPQYLSLQPGFTSDLRFHMGDRYGQNLASDRGAFLDYELSWDRGDDMEGGLTFGGLGRNDWSIDAHQYWRFDDQTSATLQFGMPANSGIVGSGSASRQFKGFSLGVDANRSQTFRGFVSSSQSYGLNLTTDPSRIAKTPFKYSYGLTALDTASSDQVLGSRIQQGAGLTARTSSDAINLDKSSTVTASLVANKLYGLNETRGISLFGVVNLSRRLSKSATMLMTYNYTQDGFNDRVLGRHAITVQGSYQIGNAALHLSNSRSLGVNRSALFGDASYRLSKQWRLSYAYTSSRYLTDDFLDYNIMLGYRIGWREVGLTWSKSTKRLGFELLGAAF